MAQEMNSKAVDVANVNSSLDPLRNQKKQGEMVFGIRIDAVPEGEAGALAQEGRFYPLTLDAKGRLYTVLPSDQKVVAQEQELLLECRNLLEQIRDILYETR